MEYDEIEELLDQGAYKKETQFDLRHILASLLI